MKYFLCFVAVWTASFFTITAKCLGAEAQPEPQVSVTPPAASAVTVVHQPFKDPIVDRVYDYTKWHIALYGAVLGVLAGGLALGRVLPRFLLVPLVSLTIAGIAAGTLASSLSRREYWEGFLAMRTFPLVPDSVDFGLSMQVWMNIQHLGIWTAIIWGATAAVSRSLKCAPPKNDASPGDVLSSVDNEKKNS